MFKNIDIIFQVEHVDRELEAYKAVAKCLKDNYGLTSIIISNMFHSYYLFFFRPKVVIWNNLTNNIGWPDGFMWETYENNIKYVSHRWEQNLFPINFQFKAPQSVFEKNEVIFFAWDQNFKDYLYDHGIKKNHIKIVGNLANDILFKFINKQSDWKNKLAKEFKLDNRRTWVFLPMNFGWAFMTKQDINTRIKNGYDEHIAGQYKNFSNKCLKKYIYFIDYISVKFEFEIILRPHTSITEQHYIDKFKEILGYVPKNVFINKAYSIREWIVASDIVGSNWSTSVWDAYQIGKKSFYYIPYEIPDWMDSYWLREVTNIKEIKEFDLFYKTEQIPKKNKFSDKSIHNFSKALVDIIPQHKPKIKKIRLAYFFKVIKYFIKNMLSKYFNFIFIQKWQIYDWFDILKFK